MTEGFSLDCISSSLLAFTLVSVHSLIYHCTQYRGLIVSKPSTPWLINIVNMISEGRNLLFIDINRSMKTTIKSFSSGKIVISGDFRRAPSAT
jgi:hypothetical protein